MEQLIDRQAAIDALGDEPEVWTGKDEYAQGLNNQWHYDRNAILALPSAQRTGEWVIDRDSTGCMYGRCTSCGMKQYAGRTKYCPNCGAKMEAEE